MKILFLDQYSSLGGAQRCLLDLLPGVKEAGWQARVAIPPGGSLVDLLRRREVQVEEIRSGPYRNGKKSAADLLRFAADVPVQTATITALLDQSRTDLLYVNGPRLLVAATLAARNRVPILFHAHHIIGQSSAAYVEGRALRRSNARVAACCEAAAVPLKKWLSADRIHVAPNGTGDHGFCSRAERKREVRIGIIGGISFQKGQVEFLKAAALLIERMPNARFVICGAPLFGDRGYYDSVLNLAASLPVEFLDWQEDVAAVMRDLDILVIPSKEEGMPRVMLEAFSAGLPVVAFPVGGIPEVITDRLTGFLTRGTSPVDLASTLRELLQSNPMRLREAAQNARREWERHYTLAAYRARIMRLMEQCVSGEITAPRPHRLPTPQ